MLLHVSTVTIRRAAPADAAAAARICYDAFYVINTAHNFPPDIPAVEVAEGFMRVLFSHPGFYCVVAEQEGRIVGSNCLDERSPIAGVGPITVEPSAQNRGAGRKLMQAVLDRARERNAPGVRLVQAAFHGRSMSLYAKLGFDVREPLAVLHGPRVEAHFEGYRVRAGKAADLEACNLVCRRVHGVDRAGEVRDALEQGSLRVVEHGGRITGYATSLGFFGHSVGESNVEIQALIGAAPALERPGILLPTRNSELFRWCLQHGLRVVEPMTLMSMGLYNEPAGAFLPSVLY
jgi:GNAT superfamily N-acetyltransferase